MFIYKSGKIEAKLENKTKLILSDISFSIEYGRSLALVGETGSGKTMTANSIMGLLPENISAEGLTVAFNSGTDREYAKSIVNGTEDKAPGKSSIFSAHEISAALPDKDRRKLLGRSVVYIPQSGLECLNPSRTVKNHMYDSIERVNKHINSAEKKKTAIEKLCLAGFFEPEKILEMYPFELSGGMGQRVSIAIAACSKAKLVIADEPTNGLDEESKFGFLNLMQNMFPDAAKLVITHDISVAKMCDYILVICKGKPMESGPALQVLESPRHPYTKSLIDALPQNGMHESFIKRSPQKPCPFYSKCGRADYQCTVSIQSHSDGARICNCNHQEDCNHQ